MRSRRSDRSNRSRWAAAASGAAERHPRLTLHWADAADQTRTSVHAVSGIPVLVVEGALGAATAKPCREAVDAVLRMRPTRMVVDLSGVRDVDATSVELLDAVRRFAHWHGVAMSLAAVPAVLAARLEVAAPTPPFDVHTTADRAVTAALTQPRARRSAAPRDGLGHTG